MLSKDFRICISGESLPGEWQRIVVERTQFKRFKHIKRQSGEKDEPKGTVGFRRNVASGISRGAERRFHVCRIEWAGGKFESPTPLADPEMVECKAE